MAENDKLKKRILSSLTNEQGYVILLLGINDFQPVKGKLWYQKEMFFISNFINALKNILNFEPYFIGPHSKRLEEVLKQLEFYRVLEFDANKIKLTDLGEEIFNQIIKKRPIEEINSLVEIKTSLNDMSNDELLLFVYSSIDPSYITESIEYKRIMGNRERLAIGLYKRGKVTLAKAAELAQLPIDEMMRMLKMRNIVIH
jgi:hypothetical protein